MVGPTLQVSRLCVHQRRVGIREFRQPRPPSRCRASALVLRDGPTSVRRRRPHEPGLPGTKLYDAPRRCRHRRLPRQRHGRPTHLQTLRRRLAVVDRHRDPANNRRRLSVNDHQERHEVLWCGVVPSPGTTHTRRFALSRRVIVPRSCSMRHCPPLSRFADSTEQFVADRIAEGRQRAVAQASRTDSTR
jgi:hypothetical protein